MAHFFMQREEVFYSARSVWNNTNFSLFSGYGRYEYAQASCLPSPQDAGGTTVSPTSSRLL